MASIDFEEVKQAFIKDAQNELIEYTKLKPFKILSIEENALGYFILNYAYVVPNTKNKEYRKMSDTDLYSLKQRFKKIL